MKGEKVVPLRQRILRSNACTRTAAYVRQRMATHHQPKGTDRFPVVTHLGIALRSAALGHRP